MNKKLVMIGLTAVLFVACKRSNSIEFDVTATGLNDGVFVVKGPGEQSIFGENVKAGHCAAKGIMEEPGFYSLDITKNNGKIEHRPFEVYLEPGKYTITADATHLSRYPKIESSSATQQELSAYYELNSKMSEDIEQKAFLLDQKMIKGKNTLSPDAFRDLSIKMDNVQEKEKTIQFDVLEAFAKKYPQSALTAHLMAKQNYKDHPEKYNKLFVTFSEASKNSDEGKEVAKGLAISLKLQAGHKAPEIAGKAFDGRSFADLIKGKKLFLIDFWRSANQFSRQNHETILPIYNDLKGHGFEVISVSVDSKQLWWATAVKDDKLPWPQISDLKGNDSPNVANWNVSTIPTYYLVDGDWKIYKKDIGLGQVRLEATQYLEKH